MAHLVCRAPGDGWLSALLLCLWGLCVGAQSANASERIALVVGNAAYAAAPLDNPTNDAAAVGDLLRRVGFQVIQLTNATRGQLLDGIARYTQLIKQDDTKLGIFYYAGHGLQLNWRNYIVPVDAKIKSGADVPQQAIDIGTLLQELEAARGRSFLVILDACRDDPFGGAYKPSTKGLSQFDAPGGSLLAYATSPGNVAQDGEGKNGLYTGNLVRELSVKGVKLEDAFKRVRLNVRMASQGAQIPWETTSLEDDVYLMPTRLETLTEEERDRLLERELSAWSRVKDTKNAQLLADFIHEFPSGYTSELAQFRMNKLFAQMSLGDSRRLMSLASAQADALRRQAELETTQRAAAPMAPSAQPSPPTRVPPPAEATVALVQPPPAAVAPAAEPLPARVANGADTPAAPSLAVVQQTAPSTLTSPAIPLPDAGQPASVSATEASPSTKDQMALVRPADLPTTPYFEGSSEHLRDYRVGDEYQIRVFNGFNRDDHRDRTMRVTAVDLAAGRVEYNQGGYVSDLMGNIVSNKVGAMNAPRQFYPAELFVGKRWQTRFKQVRPSGITYTYHYTCKVVSRETITTAAGTFLAYKIQAHGFNMELGATIDRTIWVTPGIAYDIAHEILVKLRSGKVEQFDREELQTIALASRG